MKNIGRLARELRESLGLSQRAAAHELGITNVHLCNIEKEKSSPSPELLEKYRQIWGIDLYVYAWCKYGNRDRLPMEVREAAGKLESAWRRQFDRIAQSPIAKDKEQ